MKHHHLAGAFAVLLIATVAFAQTNDAASSGPAANGSPAWFLQDMQGMIETRAKPRPDAAWPVAKTTSRNTAAARPDRCALLPVAEFRQAFRAMQGIGVRRRGRQPEGHLGTPYCYNSPVCDPTPDRGGNRLGVKAVEWKQTMGYTFAYPIASPEGERYGMVAVATGFQGQSLGPAAQSRQAGRNCSSGTAITSCSCPSATT